MKKYIPNAIKSLFHHKVLVIVLILIVAGMAVFFITRKGKKEEFDMYRVEKGTVIEALIASGKVKAKKSAQLMFKTPAKITWVGVKKGDAVGEWQGLATLDRREIEKTIKKKLSLYKEARWNLEQAYDDNDVKGLPLDKVGLLTDEEKRIIEKYQFMMDSTVWDVEIAALALEQASLVSPLSGVVVDDGKFLVGEQLTSQDIASRYIRIVDLSSLYFQADVDESEYGDIREGMPVRLVLDAFPDMEMKGTVTYVGKEGVKKTGGGIQIPVDITLEKTDAAIVPELSGDATMTIREKKDVLIINKSFARKDTSGYVVDLLRDGKKQAQHIDIGLVGVDTLEVIGGLSEGDVIVLPKKATTADTSQEHRRQ